jgi:L-asparagine transporter-like permease
MKETTRKIVFFVLSMVLLFLLYRWAYEAKDSDSPYVRFPDKIETFR